MELLRQHRKHAVAGLVALGALIGLVTFVVVPAVASTTALTSTAAASAAYSQVQPAASPSGIIPIDEPTGGQSNDCAFFYSQTITGRPTSAVTTKPQPAFQFRIANPKKGQFSYTDTTTGAIFQVTVDSTGTWASFSATGAKVVDVGIKGGTDETWYNYDQAAPAFPTAPSNDLGGYVTADGGPVTTTPGTLHAPAQNTVGPILYGVSNMTFCYNLGSVSGTVYLDKNQNGVNDTNTGPDTGQGSWTVRLYSSASSTSPIATTTSSSNGSYRFNVAFNTALNYTICEAPPSGTWGQTEPLPSTPNICSGAGELKKGYSLPQPQSTQDYTGQDFGNAPAVPCTQPMGLPNYSVQLAACKPNSYVFNSGVLPPLAPYAGGGAFVSVFAADQTQAKVADVEKITFTFTKSTEPAVSGVMAYRQNSYSRQTATLTTKSWDDLLYSDVFPFTTLKPMLICNLDPRSGELGLQTSPVDYTNLANAGVVIPNYNVDPTKGETSCLIQATQQAGGTYVAYVYSSLDGVRGTTP